MKTYRELLELAARANFGPGNFEWNGVNQRIEYIPVGGIYYRRWLPLEDDGDALRLAVKLNIHLTNSPTDAWASTLSATSIEPIGCDPCAATRRAIVKAAAIIGENMK